MKEWLVPPNIIALSRAVVERQPLAAVQPLLTDAAEWVLPSQWQTTLFQLGYRLRGLDVTRNEALRNRHQDRKRCFVIGNGPSLATMDLRPLRNELTVGANSFYKHPQADVVDLKYLCSGDHRFFVDEPRALEWHRTIEQRLPRTTLLMHSGVRGLMKQHGIYAHHDVHVFQNGLKARHHAQVHFDLTRPLNVGVSTGSLLAIPLAIFMGVREIYLIGFDCNWLESYNTSYHFYTQHELWREFDSVETDTKRYDVALTSVLREFRSHHLIQQRARSLGIRICNAGVGGRLDAHPRVRYEDLF